MNNNSSIFTNVLNGINSTLNIANKVIPIYKEAKPLLNTVSTTYKKVKENGKDINKIIKLMKLKKENNNVSFNNSSKQITNKNTSVYNPKFFI